MYLKKSYQHAIYKRNISGDGRQREVGKESSPTEAADSCLAQENARATEVEERRAATCKFVSLVVYIDKVLTVMRMCVQVTVLK